MTLSEKSAYLKGLMEGMKLDTESNEGKLISEIISMLQDVAENVSDLEEVVDCISDELDCIEEDLDNIDDYLMDDDDDEYDDEYDEDDDYEDISDSTDAIFPTHRPVSTPSTNTRPVYKTISGLCAEIARCITRKHSGSKTSSLSKNTM